VCVCCSDLQEFPGLVWCRGKGFLEKEEGEGQQQAAAGDFGNLLISFWRFIPELTPKVLACAERKQKERRKLRKREGFGKR
jgi:hypothetical protein